MEYIGSTYKGQSSSFSLDLKVISKMWYAKCFTKGDHVVVTLHPRVSKKSGSLRKRTTSSVNEIVKLY